MAKAKLTPICSICSQLPRDDIGAALEDLGKAAEKLHLSEPMSSWRNEVTRCPECGAYYYYSSSISEMEGVEHTYVRLQRLGPVDVLNVLEGKEKKAYENALAALLKRLEADLKHPHEFVRSEAAWALSQLCETKGDLSELGRLMRHADRSVRREAFRTLMYCQLDEKPWDGLLPLFEAALKDKDDDARYFAARALARRYLELNDLDKFEALLASEDEKSVAAALGQLREVVEHHYYDASRFEGLLSGLAGHRTEFIRETSQWVFGRMEENRRKGLKATKLSKYSYRLTQDKTLKYEVAENEPAHRTKSKRGSLPPSARMVPALPETITNSIGMKLRLIQPGAFRMGDEGFNAPSHPVNITEPFYIGLYPVTQREWEEVMRSNPSYHKGSDLPVEQVSWEDCQAFIEALNKKEPGGGYRMPTEAEWEYACRAGSSTRYCFGNGVNKLGEYCWYNANSDEETQPVGKKKENAWGLYDMHGNVQEWCSDRTDGGNDYYIKCIETAEKRNPEIVNDPAGPETGKNRVLRGGSCFLNSMNCLSSARSCAPPHVTGRGIGFRVVKEAGK